MFNLEVMKFVENLTLFIIEHFKNFISRSWPLNSRTLASHNFIRVSVFVALSLLETALTRFLGLGRNTTVRNA